MIDLHDIRYVRMGATDVSAASQYCTEVLGLQQIRQNGKAVYFRSDSRDHTLVYFDGDPSDHATAFEMGSAQDIEAAAKELTEAGRPVRWGSDAECEARLVDRFVEFKDPTGNKIELILRLQHSGWRYYPSRDAGITGFSHIGLRSSDVRRDELFWTKVMNARVSDWIGPSPLLRIDQVHHKIALFPSDHPGVQHINHQVASIDDVMRSWYFLSKHDVHVTFGPGRHPTSGAMFVYFRGPDGMIFEYSTGVSYITDEAAHRPRQFPFEPRGFCMWGSTPQIDEFKK